MLKFNVNVKILQVLSNKSSKKKKKKTSFNALKYLHGTPMCTVFMECAGKVCVCVCFRESDTKKTLKVYSSYE